MSILLAESMRRISGLLQSGQYSAAHSQLESLVTANPDYVEGLRLFAGTKQVLGDSRKPSRCCGVRSKSTRNGLPH